MAETNEPNVVDQNEPKPVVTDEPNSVGADEPKPAEPVEKKKSGKRKILIPIIAAAVVLVLVFAIILPAMKSSSYKKALALMEEENYADAKTEFEKLGTYMDSQWQADVCENYMEAEDLYAAAMKQYNSGNWQKAEKKLSEIQDLEKTYFNKGYKDTAELVKSCKNHQKYDEAAELMNNEDSNSDLEKAQKIFLDLGDFEDAKANAQKCQDRIEKNDAYQEACDTLDQDNYSEAIELFEALGDFKDSAEKAEECRIMVDFEAAVDLYNAGEYKEALDAFAELENTYDNAESVIRYYSTAKLDEMKNRAKAEESLAEAEQKFNDGDYTGASDILEGIDINMLTLESLDKREEMQTTIRQKGEYDQAMKYYNNGQFYEAYLAFQKCEGYKDAADMVKKCIQPTPGTGETYRNPNYAGANCSLTIYPPTDDGNHNYLKLYTTSEELVSCIFIQSGGSGYLELPGGQYIIKVAYGSGPWFGEKDMFGDDAYYYVMELEGGNYVVNVEAGYDWELSLRTSRTDGTNMGEEKTDRQNF